MQVPPFDSLTQTEFDLFYVEYTYISTTITGFTQYPVNNFTIDDVLNATQYFVRVAVNNSAGLGVYSSPRVVTNTLGLGMQHLYNSVTLDATSIKDINDWFEK